MQSFDRVQHDVLMARVGRKVGDKRLLGLIGRYLRAGVLAGETLEPTAIGTPQARWRLMHQSGRLAIMSRNRARPFSG